MEIFAGSEQVTRAWRSRGFQVYTFDKLQGPSGDLTRKAVQRRLFTLLSSSMCLGVMAGVECTSFSVARGSPVRDRDHPLGLPDLSLADAEKVKKGNLLLQIAIRIFGWCRRFSVPFAWENPLSSWQWKTPQAIKMESWEGIFDASLDSCAFEARWKKPTRIRTFLLPVSSILCHRCVPCHGLCQYSMRPHIVLQGRDQTGVNWTARASQYPKPLAKAIAKVFIEAAFSKLFAERVGDISMRRSDRTATRGLRKLARVAKLNDELRAAPLCRERHS